MLKPVHVTASGELEITDLDLFPGPDYLITVQEGACPALRTHIDQLRASHDDSHAAQLFYKVMDGAVDSYTPALDWFDVAIDNLEDLVVTTAVTGDSATHSRDQARLIELRRV